VRFFPGLRGLAEEARVAAFDRYIDRVVEHDLAEKGFVVLIGPRRVGKSVALFDLAHALCARADVHPLQVICLACDVMAPRDLRRVFTLDRYDRAWQDYLTCGGFPRAVAEHVRLGAVTTDYLRDLAVWLRRDVDPDATANATATHTPSPARNPSVTSSTRSSRGYRIVCGQAWELRT
jgi:predicted AAA+ superfamily ATPase